MEGGGRRRRATGACPVTTMVVSPGADRAYCHGILPKVSRTFALCIPLLPSGLDYATLVAYLVCRVADTIEDAVALAPDTKASLLSAWARALEEGNPDESLLGTAFPTPAGDDERLVNDADVVLREFRRLPPSHPDAVRPWVRQMGAGMAEFVRRPPGGIGTVEGLDRYTY